MEVRGGGKEVHGLALAHHHHRVGEVDCQRLTKPAKHWSAAPCWPEPFHLTTHAQPAILTIRDPRNVRSGAMMTAKASGVVFARRGAGEPLLLIHGTGGSRSHWRPVVDLLAPHRDLVLVDLPGHGESDPPPAGTPHTPIGYAQVLARLLDELGLDSAHAAGNSVGGWT